MTDLFSEFRKEVKAYLRDNNLIYRDIAEKSKLSTGTIKCFMCGANNSRRLAEKITDTLGLKMLYFNGKYYLSENKQEEK